MGQVDSELRAAVVDCARRMVRDGLVIGTSGTVSARAGDEIVITPSGRRYDTLRPEDLCVLNVAGEPVDLPLRPSSELPMHLAAYQQTKAGAVVHTHSMFATAVATACDELPAVHYTIGFLGGPLRVVPYATFGTAELADGLAAALAGRHAALLRNHGVVAVGPDVEQAYERARLTEWLAELYYRAQQAGIAAAAEHGRAGRLRRASGRAVLRRGPVGRAAAACRWPTIGRRPDTISSGPSTA